MAFRSENKFRGYEAPSNDTLRKRVESSSQNYDSLFKEKVDVFKATDGDNVVRILPQTWNDPDKYYGLTVFAHRFVGPNKGNYICLNLNDHLLESKPCPICDAALKAKANRDEDAVKALLARKLVMCWILHRESRDFHHIPQLWIMSGKQDAEICSLAMKGAPKGQRSLELSNPYEGYDLGFTRSGSGINTSYGAWLISHEITSAYPDDEKIQQEILDYIASKPIPSLLKVYPADHIRNAIWGNIETQDAQLSDEEEGAVTRVPSRPSRFTNGEPEDRHAGRFSRPLSRESQEKTVDDDQDEDSTQPISTKDIPKPMQPSAPKRVAVKAQESQPARPSNKRLLDGYDAPAERNK